MVASNYKTMNLRIGPESKNKLNLASIVEKEAMSQSRDQHKKKLYNKLL